MKTESQNKLKDFFDKVYDIVTVQLIGAVIFILIGLTVKFIGGDLYEQVRNIYYSSVNSIINTEQVTDDNNLLSDTQSNFSDDLSSDISSDNEKTSSEQNFESSDVTSSETIQTNNSAYKYSWPLMGEITANFGDIGSLFSGPDSSHTGIDISAVTGTPIKAVADGEIIYAGYTEGYGKHIIIRHGGSISSVYAHCSELLYKKGTKVNKGDIIALVGSSGKATGSHLHLSFLNKGKNVDPLWLLPPISNI